MIHNTIGSAVRTPNVFILSGLSGLLVALSFSPYDMDYLAWIALVPFFLALERSSPSLRLVSGFVCGAVASIGQFSWVTVTDGLSIPVFLLILTPLYSIYYAAFGLLTSIDSGRGKPVLLMFTWPALWIALEYLRANAGFLAFPWNLLGHTMYTHPLLIGISDFSGVFGVSFLIVMVNTYLAGEIISRKILAGGGTTPGTNRESTILMVNWKGTAIVLGILAAVTFYGAYGLTKTSAKGHFRVAAIQGNSVAFSGMSIPEQKDHIGVYRKLSLEAAGSEPELIIWPSSALPAPYRSNRLVRISLLRTVRDTGIPLLVGGAGYDKVAPKIDGTMPFSNSQFLMGADGKVSEQYNKIRLLPFNEYPPLQGVVKWPRFITTIREGFKRGDEYTVFELGDARFSTPICWENNFPDLVRSFVKRGSNLIISVSNDSFMGQTAGPYQTFSSAVFRAVENRVALVRCASTGISAFITPDGRVRDSVRDDNGRDLFVRGILTADVPLSEEKTIYTLYGDVFVFSCGGIFLILSAVSLVRRLNSKAWEEKGRR